MERILLIEDDIDIHAMMRDYLCEQGYSVESSYNGLDGIQKFTELEDISLVLLDIMLPKKSGVEVLQAIRAKSFVPVIVVSAKESEFDKATLLEIGADDYVVKPFSLIEVSARIKAALRRATSYSTAQVAPTSIFTYKDLVVNTEQYSVEQAGKKIACTHTEFAILLLFLQNPQRVFTKESIYENVWNERYYGDENIVNVQMSRLRDKLDDKSKSPRYIETLWGIGYRLRDEHDSK